MWMGFIGSVVLCFLWAAGSIWGCIEYTEFECEIMVGLDVDPCSKFKLDFNLFSFRIF